MDENFYISLINKLESIESKFLTHVLPTEPVKDSVGFITPDINLEEMSQEKLSLLHTMLHMFAANHSGKGLTKKTIEQLHKNVKEKLKNHKKYDKLDEV